MPLEDVLWAPCKKDAHVDSFVGPGVRSYLDTATLGVPSYHWVSSGTQSMKSMNMDVA